MQKHVFYAKGMHCRACVLLVEEDLLAVAGVTSAAPSLDDHTVTVEGDFGGKDSASIAAELSAALAAHGYSLSATPFPSVARWEDFKTAAPIALILIALFVALQKIGLVNLVGAGEGVSYGTAFLIGVVASVSSCMAVVGGLLLSVSATFAKRGERVRPQVTFHAARLVSFFLLGGAVGALGAAFTLSPMAGAALSFILGLVMLTLGLKLLGVFPWADRLQVSLPKFLSRGALGAAKRSDALAPLALGVSTFFLPCGFTQSMQVYALSTGSFLSGGLVMLAFALGTLPVLAAVSASPALGPSGGKRSSVFFKVAGLVVIAFALLNIAGSLVAAGVLPPFINL